MCPGLEEVKYLGYSVSDKGIKIQGRVVKAVEDWPTPKNDKEVQRFLGLPNFYRRCMKNYAEIVLLLTNLVRHKAFRWDKAEETAFKEVKKRLKNAPL